ncbi:hypothetical protein ACFWGP_05530 [Agromyces sp. NPDC127015]|uniref:hypothetical protein n=1 Tax=Agromyces sp. NPDC127015 TaxID=3347108 RepID=UPI0036608F20
MRSAPFYWLVCDYPGCNRSSTEDGDYAAFDSIDFAKRDARENEWVITTLLDHFCVEHTIEDEETGERSPMPDTFEARVDAIIRNADERLEGIVEMAGIRAGVRIREAQRRLDEAGGPDRHAIRAGEIRAANLRALREAMTHQGFKFVDFAIAA